MELICGLQTLLYQQTHAYLSAIESEGCAKQLCEHSLSILLKADK